MPRVAFSTALGTCGLAWNEAGLTAFTLPGAGSADAPESSAELEAAPAWVADLVSRVQRHLAGDLQGFADVPLDSSRVPERAWRVYAAARGIPAGHTCTYGELADRMGEPRSESRAIGAWLGSNPWPLIVPCHRIVGAGGRLTGFSAPGGVRTKARLLAIEGAQLLAE